MLQVFHGTLEDELRLGSLLYTISLVSYLNTNYSKNVLLIQRSCRKTLSHRKDSTGIRLTWFAGYLGLNSIA